MISGSLNVNSIKSTLTKKYFTGHSQAMAFSFMHIKSLIFILFIAAGCNKTENKEPLEYKGPLSEAEDVETYYTENNLVKVKMKAALVYEKQNGDREFPKGIYIEFFNEFGRMASTLRANHAYFFKEENLWRGRGKVEVKNIEKNEQLNTEELFWKQLEEKIYTEKFVTIRQQGDVIYGEGMEAKQDMSDYIIKRPTGTITVKED
jgi:LPS export ABC transporter protein LptC